MSAAPIPPSDAILDRLLRLHPKIIDLTLERVHRLLGAMDHPERALAPVVHVAGTNGKGSVVAMLRAGLEAGAARVQAYTSPHLARFHERIRLADGLIAEPALAALLEECEAANAGAPITFFEITTVAAFVAFAREEADWCLLEVGLGGRLDATNVVDRPALTAITPVSLDHQQYLGETLGEIAAEKAGILKPGVACVVGPQPEEAMAAIARRAGELGAPLLLAGRDWTLRREGARLAYEDDRGALSLPLPALRGAHQEVNAGIAVACLSALGAGDPAAALTRAVWPARMQRLERGPMVEMLPAGAELWLDGGHNAAAGEALAALLEGMARTEPAPVRLIAGLLETKAAEGYFQPLAGVAGSVATVTIPDTDAAIPAPALAARARAAGLAAEPAESPEAALGAILARHGGGPLRIVICGSLYLAGAVLTSHG